MLHCSFSRNGLYDKIPCEHKSGRGKRMAEDKWANPQKMWDERFSQPQPVYGETPNEFLAEQSSRFQRGMKLLVPGDGYGRNGIWLAQQGFQVHTVDLSPVGVERARKSAQAAGVSITIEQTDLGTWNWPVEQFDGVFSIFVHLPPDMRAKVHASMLRSLKPGGLVILQNFSPAQLKHSSGGPKQVELLYTAAMLRQDFAPAVALELEEKEIHVNEGHMHSGPAAVVQAVFRK
jgi:2-polyprenyl-3-methyl-5-hydroxy-6-metoxy-1,4-benzoquinol methylase